VTVAPTLGPVLLAFALAAPLALAGAWTLRPLRRLAVGAAPWAAAPALVLTLLELATPLPFLPLERPDLSTGLRWALDGLGTPFLLFTSLLWLFGGIFAGSYHRDDPRRDRFFLWFLLTLSGNLGLVLAGNILTFYLFFAVMSFSAYGLVAHAANEEAFRAARVYMALAVVGEALLLWGLLTLSSAVGGEPGFGTRLELAWAALPGSPAFVAGLLLAGLGVKAGLLPLHFWLPLAHPVAPTAASALLSGAMIKAGLLGWLRLVPPEEPLSVVGGALVIVGIVTAVYGVIVGLTQEDPKTVLAYSSISQMGNAAVGMGALLLFPGTAPIAGAALALFALHHGIAKAALFLSVGVVDRLPVDRTRPAHRPWRPLVALGLVLPALALAGAPLTSGAAAKGMLKAILSEGGGAWYRTLDPLLLLAATGTTLLMVRFLVTLRARANGRRERESDRGSGGRLPTGLLVPWGALVAIGISVPLWASAVLPLPEGRGLPGPFEAFRDSLVPLAIGLALGVWVLSRPGLLGPLSRMRWPAGDLVVLVERSVRWIRVIGIRPLPAPPPAWRKAAVRLRSDVETALVALTSRDLLLVRGVSLGLILLGLAVGLTLGLLPPP